jgi:hypothetical protein
MGDFDVALRGFAALDGEALSQPWSWRDKAMDVLFALYRTLAPLPRWSQGAHSPGARLGVRWRCSTGRSCRGPAERRHRCYGSSTWSHRPNPVIRA